MKQTIKLFSISFFVVGTMLIGYVLLPQDSPFRPPSDTHPTPTKTPHQPTPTPSTTSTVDSTLPPKISPVAPAALPTISKHAELKQSIAHEYIYRMFATPNDPLYSTDWSLQKVNAPAAWDTTTGNGQTVVAVIDSGFALSHQDLADQWHTNDGENGQTQAGDRCWTGTAANKQTNNCDDDNNGYKDDWRGWNFALNDNNPQTGRTNPTGDGVQHGTEVAGFVGASGNNNHGSTAINWDTQIMPLQALDDNGLGYTSAITAAIYYAVDNGAQVVNMSLGTYSNDPALKTAIDYASAHNVVVVAAAGNCGNGGGDCASVPIGAIGYPALYPDVISVGASTQSDQRSGFSSYGTALDVMAPGSSLPVATSWSQGNPTSRYVGGISGTSFATPQVSSLASLIRSIRPNSSIQDVTALITATASHPSGMNGAFYSEQFGHGIINANSAIAIAQNLNTTPTPTPALLQTGSFISEHTAPMNAPLKSSCEGTANSACVIQLTSSATGHKRYLNYSTIPIAGVADWSWSNSLSLDEWEIRARSGDAVSDTAYWLVVK